MCHLIHIEPLAALASSQEGALGGVAAATEARKDDRLTGGGEWLKQHGRCDAAEEEFVFHGWVQIVFKTTWIA